METFIFYCIAVSACSFAVLAVSSRDVFHSAVWLALTLLSVSGVYFYLGAELLGVVQILVYVGGIMTLFIFAIQLTAKIGDKTVRHTNDQKGAAFLICAIIFAFMVYAICTTPFPDQGAAQLALNNTAGIGRSLFVHYVLAFELLSAVLLAALMGALILAKKETVDHPGDSDSGTRI